MFTRYETKKIFRLIMFFSILFIVIGYAIFATHDFILGPSLSITEPANGSSFTYPNIQIKGVAKRIQNISFNGNSITIDDKGNFNEVALLAPGYNIFTFIILDKFGRSKEYRLEYIYKVN